ncbi:hypothetical protein QFZ49_003519 [Streptomyces turgidiscabies]|uniref:Uncharacterized protein n=1 Tax=Streptomyces turgidiscabies TaxID=85558 RepID=A0ABU0RNK5_9ACTN|nr:hypothetical protein [Streptomyces turgidiscabies]
MSQLQGDLAVVPGGDEGDGLVADDEALDEFVDGSVFHLAVRELIHVGERLRTVAGRVLVERPDGHTTFDQRPVALQPLGEDVLEAPAARLHREHLGLALGRGQVECRVDPFEALQHGDRVRGGGRLCGEGHERLERIGQFDRQLSALGDLPLEGVEPLRQSDRRRQGTKPVRVVGIRMKQGELHQARCGLDLCAGYAPRAQSIRIKAGSFLAQVRHRVGMCRFSRFHHQISTPQGPERAGT